MPPSEQLAAESADTVVTTSSAIVTIAPDVEYKESEPVPQPNRKRRALIAITAALLVVGAIVGTIVTMQHKVSGSTAIDLGSGHGVSVCYDSYNQAGIVDHFKRIKERFSGVRTFQTRGIRNHIEVAAQTGLKIYAGVWIRGDDVEGDFQAALWGAKMYPDSIAAILVGNEELHVGYDQYFVIEKVKYMKRLLEGAGIYNVKVGSVQTDGGWLFQGAELAKHCDVLGVNIHPFFGASDVSRSNPILDLDARWKAMVDRFGKKVVMTETGWPTSGNPNGGHVPDMGMAKKYINDVKYWANNGAGGYMPAYFMFHDNNKKPQDFEKAFGLAWDNGYWKFDFDSSGPSPGPAPENPPTDQIQGVVFVNANYNKVLAAGANRQVEFHPRWDDWRADVTSHWTVRGQLWASWEPNTRTDVCLDAYEPWNGGTVHLWPCDANNRNQQWKFDGSQLRHVTHQGFCLDMKYAEGGTPHLWECLDVPLQKLQWWK